MDVLVRQTGEELGAAIRSKRSPFVFIAGAGVSVPSGLPQWKTFATSIAQALVVDADIQAPLQEAALRLRPEVLLQALYRGLGDAVFSAMQALDPPRLKERGVLCEPNTMHFFLAEMISLGHTVVTTNFDNLIETAFTRYTKGNLCPVVATSREIGRIVPDIEKGRYSGLIKAHGTLRHSDGTEATESITALLQQVQRAIPTGLQRAIHSLLESRRSMVLGYSGLDDYDLFQLLAKPRETARYPMVWIQFAPGSEQGWTATDSGEVEVHEEPLPGQLDSPDYYATANPATIIKATGGVLVSADTPAFLARFLTTATKSQPTPTAADVEKAVQVLIRDWASGLENPARQLAVANVFESAGVQFYDRALAQAHHLWGLGDDMARARYDLTAGRLLYKKGDMKAADQAQALLRSSSTTFMRFGLVKEAAEAQLQLSFLLSRRAASEPVILEALLSAEQAVALYSDLSVADPTHLFELGIALRAYALSLHRSLPDLDAISDKVERVRCEGLLGLAREYAEASLLAINATGNYLGERGQGQSLNVLGLIDLKVGGVDSLSLAKQEFEQVIDWSKRSGKGFEREQFQGRRNLALVHRAMARLARPDAASRILVDAEQELARAENILMVTGGPSADLFNVRFNLILCVLDRKPASWDWNSVVSRLDELSNAAPRDRDGKISWHWNAWLQATAAKAALMGGNPQEVVRRVTTVTTTYERTPSDQIVAQAYGVQNGGGNLATCALALDALGVEPDLRGRVRLQADRLSGLSQRVPAIHAEPRIAHPKVAVQQLVERRRY